VERDALDKSRVYIQIVEVTPYFTPEELLVRKTPFSRSFDLSTHPPIAHTPTFHAASHFGLVSAEQRASCTRRPS
jgi:hypothetical protein